MFLLVLAHPGCPAQNPKSRKMVVCVCAILVSHCCCILKVIIVDVTYCTWCMCLCSTVLMLLKMVVEYCQLTSDIPTATPEILNRLIELLKVQCCVTFVMSKN